MAAGVNKVILLGNLGADPELKYLPSGQAVCEMRVATTLEYKDKSDQKQERTEWHKVVMWGKTAENAAKHLHKGQQVYIDGRLQTRSWDSPDGKKNYTTEIVAEQVVFLRGGDSASRSDGSFKKAKDSGAAGDKELLSAGDFSIDDEIPF